MYSTVFHGLFLPAIESLQAGLFERLVDDTTAALFYRGVVVQGRVWEWVQSCLELARLEVVFSRPQPVGYSLLQRYLQLPTRSFPKAS